MTQVRVNLGAQARDLVMGFLSVNPIFGLADEADYFLVLLLSALE